MTMVPITDPIPSYVGEGQLKDLLGGVPGGQLQTLPCRSPEVLWEARRLTAAIDTWSVGITFMEMAGEIPTMRCSAANLAEAWMSFLGPVPSSATIDWLQYANAPGTAHQSKMDMRGRLLSGSGRCGISVAVVEL